MYNSFPVCRTVFPAATNGSDYLGVSVDLVFTAGSINGTMQCLNVTIFDDSLVESNETFTVIMTTSSLVLILGNNVTTVVIMDNDRMIHVTVKPYSLTLLLLLIAAEVSVPAVLNVTEDEGAVQVCATLSLGTELEVDITVTLATSDGTGMRVYKTSNSSLCEPLHVFPIATNGSDYLGVSMDLIFTAGITNGTMQCLNAIINTTCTVEEDETFTVTLTTSSSVVTLGNDVTTVVIMDNDSMTHNNYYDTVHVTNTGRKRTLFHCK